MADLDVGTLLCNQTIIFPPKKTFVCNGEKRLSYALTKILDSSYSFSDDTILEKLYFHLAEKLKEGDDRNDVLLSWLFTVVREWDNLKKNIKAFALKLGGAVACSPAGRKRMVTSELLQKISEVFRLSSEHDVSITLAYVEMLSEVVKTVDGCRWLLSSGLWEHVLHIYSSSQSIYVTRKTQGLIITVILVLLKVEIDLCRRIIDSLLNPLNIHKLAEPLPSRQEMLMSAQSFVNCSVLVENVSDMCEDDQNNATELSKASLYDNEKILSTIRLLCSLFDALLENKCSVSDVNSIFENYNLYLWSWEKFSCEKHNSKLIGALSSLILYIIYSTMPRTEKKNVTEADLLDTQKSFLFLIQSLTSKRKYLIVNNICVQSQMLAEKLISTPVYLCKEDGVTYNFCSQILFLHALPIFIFLKLARIIHTDVTDKFADKLFTLTSISVKRVCYQYRDTIRVCPQCCNTEELLRSSVQTLVGILKYLNKDQVVMVFQSLMHLLREFVPDEYTYMNKVVALESFELVRKYPNLLMDILDGIEITIKNYNITWSESLETSCVLVLLMSLSCISDLTTPLSTKLLRLIHLAISNFIPPNLALLVENFKNSSLELLGPLLMRKLHDVHWEVRDSSLEVLQTLSSLSALKFPAFQNLLLELNFPYIIITVFECDEESYVRSSAVVCLQKMVQVKRVWEEALVDKNLLEKMLNCLKVEPEGIVRKEAVSLITAICVNHEISSDLMDDVYKQLVLSATSDLHWEVKVSSLAFWDAIIDRETANQGMIDGVFPAVTFSKKSRKIVTLTPSEIENRLKVVLDDLEKQGCLQVLWTALNDMCDLEVARKSAIIIAKLLKLLQQYGVVEETCGRATVLPQLMHSDGKDSQSELLDSKKNCESSKSNEEKDEMKTETGKVYPCEDIRKVTADEVIKSITDSRDIELLSSVYTVHSEYKNQREENEILTSGDEERKACNEAITKKDEFMKVNEFIKKVTSLNLESVIKARSDWLTASDNLDSLIDNILADMSLCDGSPGAIDVNAKDCY